MVTAIKCSRPAIIRQGRMMFSALLIAAFSAGCGGAGSTESSFYLAVDIVNPGQTAIAWSPCPECNTYQVVRDGQQIIGALGGVAYTDRDLLAGARYCYVVRARGPTGALAASSNEVCVTMPEFSGRQTGVIDTQTNTGDSYDNDLNDAGVLVAVKNGGRRARTLTDVSPIAEARKASGSGRLANERGVPLPVTSLASLSRERQRATIPLG